ncbi:MAG: hypothetical protein R8G66_09860 [Cytophagales bacterium]|nr:hypothetical protein [Cytophagales bacterium]
MSSYTYISASWTINSNNEEIELFPDDGVQDHQMEAMEYTFLDILELYQGTYKYFDEDELKGLLLYSKYHLADVPPRSCARAYWTMLLYMKAFMENYPDLYHSYWEEDSPVGILIAQLLQKDLHLFDDYDEVLLKNKEDLSDLNDHERLLMLYLSDALKFTHTVYEKAVSGAHNIVITVITA